MTALGQEITYTTVIPGTTMLPSIVSAVTAIPTIADERAKTLVLTEVASIVVGTTIVAHTSTVTTRVAAPSATAKGLASILEPFATFMAFALFLGIHISKGFHLALVKVIVWRYYGVICLSAKLLGVVSVCEVTPNM